MMREDWIGLDWILLRLMRRAALVLQGLLRQLGDISHLKHLKIICIPSKACAEDCRGFTQPLTSGKWLL